MRPFAAMLLVSVILIGGCTSDSFHEPKPPSLTVENRTDKDLRLYYVRGSTELPDIGVAPGTSTSFTLAFGLESATCASSWVLAKDGSNVIAKIDQPCAGATWTINPAASSAPS